MEFLLKPFIASSALIALVMVSACGSSGSTAQAEPDVGSASPTAGQRLSTEVGALPRTVLRTLAAGELNLAAARSFREAGFHEVLVVSRNVPLDLGQSAGQRLILTLKDSGRPEQTCSNQHPLSGCATVDWSDDTSRPKVPPGGVFDNSLNVRLVSGVRDFFLSESGGLNDAPDPFDPG